MRIPAIALAAAGAATASLLLTAPAHATTAKPADPAALPTYTCAAALALRDLPPTVLGVDCVALNGAPAEGISEGPVLITSPTGPLWICGGAVASPGRVVAQGCLPG